jgi:spermidine/putrescine-binding protein
MKSKLLTITLIGGLVLAACAPASAPTAAPQATSAPAATRASAPGGAWVSRPSDKTASSGFVCPEPQPRLDVASTEVNIFVWTEYIPQDAIECFEQVYGITVNREEYSANEEMYAKLNAGGTNYDVAQPTDYWIQLMIRQGLLQKWDKSRLPVLSTFDPAYLNQSFDPGNEYSIPYQAGTYGIVYNKDKITKTPTAWQDLWTPEYISAGRMVFLDDNRASIGLTLLTLGYDVNTRDEAQLEEAKAKLLELRPAIKLFDSDSPKTALIAGDVDMGMTWTGEAILAQRENPAIDYVYPSEGTILWMDNYVMLANAPHLDAAYAWLNYSMQPDVFWLMLRDFPYTMPSRGALDFAAASDVKVEDSEGNQVSSKALFDQYMASPITNTPADVVARGHRFSDVGEAAPLYDRIWTEVKGDQ